MSYEAKPNQANCFKKEGFEGYSGLITLEDGKKFWVTVYDNKGAKGEYRGVRLKAAQDKQGSSKPVEDNSRTTNPGYVDPMEDDIPFMSIHDAAIC